jgi:RNA polymerase sigma-70 factor, ECF subfamily
MATEDSLASGHEPPMESAASVIERPETAVARLSAAALFRAHSQWVASFLMRLGVSPSSIDDLVQEVFLVAHRRNGYEPGGAKPTTWLAEIAMRVLSTHRRTERRRRVLPNEDALTSAISLHPSPERTAEERSVLALVERALNELDLKKRAVFVLFELMGESCDDIARGLSIPVGTVHSRLGAARRQFQDAFVRLEGSEHRDRRSP